jgi:hypothetical protein
MAEHLVQAGVSAQPALTGAGPPSLVILREVAGSTVCNDVNMAWIPRLRAE